MIDLLPRELAPPLVSEIRKATTLRYPRVLASGLAWVAVLAPSVSAVLAGPRDPGGQPVTGAATLGLYIALLVTSVVAAVYGAVAAAGEYHHDTLLPTVLFTADRDRMAGAKYLVTGGLAAGAAVLTAIGAVLFLALFGQGKFELSLLWLGVVGGGIAAAICWSVIGTGIGLLLRTPALAAGAVLVWLLVVEPLLWVITAGIGIPGAATLLPGSATLSAVFAGSFPDSDLLAPAPVALVVLLLWAIGLGGAGWWSVRKAEL